MSVAVALTVNGEARTVEVDARDTLLDVVRDRLGLTGTHGGCEQGACGACTVLLDGEVARSCLVLGVQADGHAVTTIEAIGAPGRLHPVQQAMADHHGLQCGFCTPGMVLAAIDLLARVPAPDARTVREALAGNLCRCTGYTGLVAAVVAAGRAAAGDTGAGRAAAGDTGAGATGARDTGAGATGAAATGEGATGAAATGVPAAGTPTDPA